MEAKEIQSEMVFTRVTVELSDRFDALVRRMPGTKSEHVRLAIERYIAEEERKLLLLERIDG